MVKKQVCYYCNKMVAKTNREGVCNVCYKIKEEDEDEEMVSCIFCGDRIEADNSNNTDDGPACCDCSSYCDDCDTSHACDDVSHCDGCGNNTCGEHYECSKCKEYFCEECISKCKSCEKHICTNCEVSCQGCGSTFCEDCLTVCDECGESHCEDCLHSCPTCKKSLCEICMENSCDECEESICDNCLTECKKCSDSLCKKCLKKHNCKEVKDNAK